MNRPNQELEVSSDCFPNIGARGRRRRMVKGAISSLFAAVAIAALLARRAHPLVFLALAPLVAYAMVLFMQAREKT